jgi:hypothetical protein
MLQTVNPGRPLDLAIAGSRRYSMEHTLIFRSLVLLSVSLMARKYIPCLAEPQEGLLVEKVEATFLGCPFRRYNFLLSVIACALESYAVPYSAIPNHLPRVSLVVLPIPQDQRGDESQSQHNYRQHLEAMTFAFAESMA